MNLNNLPKIVEKPYRRIGRGHGSGRVKTSGRGTKGQKARENISAKFAGSSLQASWLKRLPLVRGKGKNKSHQEKAIILNLKDLSSLKSNSDVTIKSLKENGIIGKLIVAVKLVGDGELSVPLNVKIPTSRSAMAKIQKAGGKIL